MTQKDMRQAAVQGYGWFCVALSLVYLMWSDYLVGHWCQRQRVDRSEVDLNRMYRVSVRFHSEWTVPHQQMDVLCWVGQWEQTGELQSRLLLKLQ